MSGYYLLKKGEFAYNKSYSNGYPLGAIKRLNRYNKGVLSTLYICFKSIGVDGKFLEIYYDSDKWHREVSQHTAEGARNHGLLNISAKDFFSTNLSIPNFYEQNKVSNLFKNVNDTITLHQRKLDTTNSLKKTMLSKMFPKSGQDKPELRFNEYTDAWEQRKVSELFKVTRGNVLAVSKTSKIRIDKMKYPVYSSQTLNNGLMGYYDEYLFENAITWTTDGANAGTVKYRPNKFYSTNVNGVLLSESGYACKAISEALNLVAWRYVSHVGNPKLMNNVMSDISLSIATNINELQLISDFLTKLDHTITLHHRMCKRRKLW